jgi:hypothetical protein
MSTRKSWLADSPENTTSLNSYINEVFEYIENAHFKGEADKGWLQAKEGPVNS